MTIIELIENAQADVDRLKNPSVSDFRNFIDPISMEAGEGGTGNDKIESIDIRNHNEFPSKDYEKFLFISMSYEVRCCHQTRQIKLPMRVVLADDPVKAAKVWKLEQQAATAKRKMSVALRDAHQYSKQYDAATVSLAALQEI